MDGKACLSVWRGSQIHRKWGSHARAGLIANQMHWIERMKKNQRSYLSDLPTAGHVGQTKSCLYSDERTLFSSMYLLKKEGPLFWLPLSTPGCPWNSQSSCISLINVDPSYVALTMFLIKRNGESRTVEFISIMIQGLMKLNSMTLNLSGEERDDS